MKIIIDLPDVDLPTDEQQTELGHNLMTRTYAYMGTAPNVKFVDDDAIDDAIEDVLLKHGPNYDNQCGCGVLNNMDGDVLHAHRLGVFSEAIRSTISVGPPK